MLGTRGLENLHAGINSQNKRGFSHSKEEQQQPQQN
jgi:hypothetical protein